jgi:glycosyltransferase involved in cell wall biosynthesis
MPTDRPRTALVHHWLTGMRGGEKVLEALCELLPDADLFTLVCDPAQISDRLRRHAIRTSFIQSLPFGRRRFRAWLPLFPLAAEQFDLSGYDLVISSDASVIKGVLTPPTTPHVCYCHSPPRYLWDMYHLYRREEAGRLQRWLMPPVAHYLRLVDHLAAQRVDHFVANSRAVAGRISRHYRRSSRVIYPPVETAWFGGVQRRPAEHYLFVGQLVAYKKADLAIRALGAMGRPLVVVGDGPQRRRLEASAPPCVRFAGRVDDSALRDEYGRCRALIFPNEEDFGIVPVEAQAAGVPVIALGKGGALETVVDGVTGLHFTEATVAGLQDAIHRFETAGAAWDPQACRDNARRFDRAVFLRAMADLIATITGGCLPDPVGASACTADVPPTRDVAGVETR